MKRVLSGVPLERAASLGAMANPDSMGFFVALAKERGERRADA